MSLSILSSCDPHCLPTQTFFLPAAFHLGLEISKVLASTKRLKENLNDSPQTHKIRAIAPLNPVLPSTNHSSNFSNLFLLPVHALTFCETQISKIFARTDIVKKSLNDSADTHKTQAITPLKNSKPPATNNQIVGVFETIHPSGVKISSDGSKFTITNLSDTFHETNKYVDIGIKFVEAQNAIKAKNFVDMGFSFLSIIGNVSTKIVNHFEKKTLSEITQLELNSSKQTNLKQDLQKLQKKLNLYQTISFPVETLTLAASVANDWQKGRTPKNLTNFSQSLRVFNRGYQVIKHFTKNSTEL